MTTSARSGMNSSAGSRSGLPPAWTPSSGASSPNLAGSGMAGAGLASPGTRPGVNGTQGEQVSEAGRISASTATATAPPTSSYEAGSLYEAEPSAHEPAAQRMQGLPSEPVGHDQQPFAPRVARLTVASIDPFSVLKVSFLLSVAAGVALVCTAVVLWMVLKGIGVFDQLNNLFGTIGGLDTAKEKFNIYDYVGLNRVLSISIVIGFADVLLLTALSTVSALLYNLSAGLVGGVRVTLSDE